MKIFSIIHGLLTKPIEEINIKEIIRFITSDIYNLLLSILMIIMALIIVVSGFSLIIGSSFLLVLGHPEFMFLFYYICFLVLIFIVIGSRRWNL